MACGERPSLRSAGLCVWPGNGAAVGSGAQGSPEQGRQDRGEQAGQRLPEQPVMRASSRTRARIQGRGRTQAQPEWALQPGAAHELCSHVSGWEPSCATGGWMSQGLSLKPCLLPGQGPAVCHRTPPYQKHMRDFSKPVITSVFLSWIHLRWLIIVMHRGSNSCPTLYFSTTPLTVSLLVSTWHNFLFLQ